MSLEPEQSSGAHVAREGEGKPEQRPRPRRGISTTKVILWALAGLLVVFLVVTILLPPMNIDREPPGRIKCASNLRQIGLGIEYYAKENGGRLPDRIEDVLLTQDLTADVFICPNSGDTVAPGSTKQEQAARFSTGGHLSYVYVGKGLKNPTDRVVLAYDVLGNHNKDGINVLFGDGHVEFVSRSDATELVRRADAGERPLVWEPRATAATRASNSPRRETK